MHNHIHEAEIIIKDCKLESLKGCMHGIFASIIKILRSTFGKIQDDEKERLTFLIAIDMILRKELKTLSKEYMDIFLDSRNELPNLYEKHLGS